MINRCIYDIGYEKYVLIVLNELQTVLLGAKLAKICVKNCLIYLHGDIGTGKSVVCKGFLKALGYVGHVKSPTYTVIESYFLFNRYIHHIDLYRLHSKEDLINMGLQDYFDQKSIVLIEWPKLEMNILPSPDILIFIDYNDFETSRKITLQAYSDFGQMIIKKLLYSGNFKYDVQI